MIFGAFIGTFNFHDIYSCRQRKLAIKSDTFLPLFDNLTTRNVFDPNFVGFGDMMARMHQVIGKVSIVS